MAKQKEFVPFAVGTKVKSRFGNGTVVKDTANIDDYTTLVKYEKNVNAVALRGFGWWHCYNAYGYITELTER